MLHGRPSCCRGQQLQPRTGQHTRSSGCCRKTAAGHAGIGRHTGKSSCCLAKAAGQAPSGQHMCKSSCCMPTAANRPCLVSTCTGQLLRGNSCKTGHAQSAHAQVNCCMATAARQAMLGQHMQNLWLLHGDSCRTARQQSTSTSCAGPAPHAAVASCTTGPIRSAHHAQPLLLHDSSCRTMLVARGCCCR